MPDLAIEKGATMVAPTPAKKKFPAWAKVLIVLAALGMFLFALAGVGIYFLGKGTEIALEKTIEKALRKEGKDVDVDLCRKRAVFPKITTNTLQPTPIPAGLVWW